MANELKFEGKVQFGGTDPLSLPKATSDPGSAADGDMYYNTATHRARLFQNGTWNDVGAGSVFINKFTLSPTDISNGFVTLTSAPSNPANVKLDVIGGPTQDYNVDFTISGSSLIWGAYALQGVLASGDKLIVQFD